MKKSLVTSQTWGVGPQREALRIYTCVRCANFHFCLALRKTIWCDVTSDCVYAILIAFTANLSVHDRAVVILKGLKLIVSIIIQCMGLYKWDQVIKNAQSLAHNGPEQISQQVQEGEL